MLINLYVMIFLKKLKIRIFIILFLCFAAFNAVAQHTPRITVQVSPLLSYLNIKNENSAWSQEGIETPRLGYSVGLRAEFDLDKYLGINIGINYERRHNEYTVNYQDVEDTPIYLPDRSNTKYTYEFYALPVSFKIKYFNRSKISIYQNLGLQVSWLQSIAYESTAYDEETITSSSGNYDEYAADNIVSIFSSVGISRKINDKWAVIVEPGVIYTLNSFMEYSVPNNDKEQRFFDIKVDVGLTYYF